MDGEISGIPRWVGPAVIQLRKYDYDKLSGEIVKPDGPGLDIGLRPTKSLVFFAGFGRLRRQAIM